MERLTETTFTLGPSKYAYFIEHVEPKPESNVISFNVFAACVQGERAEERHRARVDIKPALHQVTTYVDDKPPVTFDGFETNPEGIDTLMNDIPLEVIDPVLGCAIKAGVGALLAQAIQCFRALQKSGLWRQIWEFLACMRRHFLDISKSALFRLFQCIFFG